MARLLNVVLLSLALGAAGMYAITNFRIRLEPLAAETPAPAPKPPAPEPPEPAKPGVVPASFVAPALLPASVTGVGAGDPKTPATPAPPPPASPRLLTVEDQPLTWDASAEETQIYLLGTTPKLVFQTPLVSQGLKVTVNGVAVTVGDDQAVVLNKDGALVWNLAKLKEQRSELAVAVNYDKAEGKPARVTLIRPMTVPTSGEPLIVQSYSTSPYLDTTPIASKVTIAGTYLALAGTMHGRGGQIRFVAKIDPNSSPFELREAQVAIDPSGSWSARLTLPNYKPGITGKLAVRLETPDGHYYRTPLIDFDYAARPTVGTPTEITLEKATGQGSEITVKAGTPTANALPVYLANTNVVKVVVPVPTGAEAVRLYVDTDTPFRTELASRKGTDGKVVFDKVPLGAGSLHVVRADAVAADVKSETFQVVARVQMARPAVESVSAPGFGAGGDVDKIAIRFTADNKLDPTAAKTADRYEVIFNEGGQGTTITAATTPTKLGTIDYDDVTNTVTLALIGVKPGSYTVAVKDTLADIFGNKVEIVPGLSANRAYQTVLYTARIDAPLPSVSTGVTLQTGPNVTFEEYTKFRKPQDGFNPSDRVETRVVRLYYNRDANRVAQIVNRDVKSYNAAAVDVRRRVADRTRDNANSATDERQRLERQAVEAATRARAAERELQDLQNKAQADRGQASEALISIRNKELELEQARRDLEQAQIAAQTRAATDPTADIQIQRVEQLQSDIQRLRAEIETQTEVLKSTKTTAAEKQQAELELRRLQIELVDAQAKLVRAREDALRNVDLDTDVQAQQKKVSDAEVAREAALRAWTQAGAANKEEALAKLNTAETNLAAQSLALQQLLARKRNDQNTTTVVPKRDEVERLEKEITKTRLILGSATAGIAEKMQAEADLRKMNLQLEQLKREQERALAAAKGRAAADTASTTDPVRQRVERLESDLRTLKLVQSNAENAQRAARDRIEAVRARLMAAREEEVKTNESAKVKAAEELRLREQQFRSEVAAAKEDPDIYVPGVPDSLDPVRQCSLSVIGEGLIQIRGPIKGLNVIRTMINLLDAPVGQVRVNIHTVQVNGERAERMERVVANIQRYLDASRFLTEQAAQMLRKAVTSVASRKAEEAAMYAGPNCSQAERDLKYLHAFFGKDFIDELRSLDSEFLKTGNKLLSLHSMDSTSLSAAMFLLALAKNNVRREIMMEFQTAIQRDLPVAEMNFYRAGLSGGKCEACFDKKYYVLAYNAQFQSFLGYFNGEVQGDDTMTPIQREFVRLAQIFKSRMITELQLKQRVMERSLLEERIGRSYIDELRKAAALEDQAKAELAKFRDDLRRSVAKGQASIFQIVVALEDIEAQTQAVRELAAELERRLEEKKRSSNINEGPQPTVASQPIQVRNKRVAGPVIDNNGIQLNEAIVGEIEYAGRLLSQFVYFSDCYKTRFAALKTLVASLKPGDWVERKSITDLRDHLSVLAGMVQGVLREDRQDLNEIFQLLKADRLNVNRATAKYKAYRDDVLQVLEEGTDIKKQAREIFAATDPIFRELELSETTFQTAEQKARDARRPLDEKKLLDLLVDEVEDKYIEMLEGTRAHTANIDNYLKGLATALETDFNTQFYQPAFRQVRSASRARDVAFAQVETTTVLANNRAFAKVSPAASMEFDLPKRDILITEGFKAAKAAVDEYGALLSDPSFLALTRMYSGLPVSSQSGGFGGASPVRNVLPGLSSSPDEMLMAQSGPGRKEFGAAFEALIPDPAIYKIETGTGYELRPVLSPDGQCVVFNFNYMYTTDVREPVRADEKHLGRVKRHFINTDVQLSNYELREVSKYQVGLKASRTSKGVQLLEDIPGVGALFRPAPSAESSLQQNLIYAQSTIYPTLFDLMGLRYAPAIADLDPRAYINDEWVVRNRRRDLEQRIFDVGATRVDEALRIPYGERRPDLYRSQETIPYEHPNGYSGPGLRLRDSYLREGHPEEYDPRRAYPETPFAPRGGSPRPADPLFGPRGYSVPGDSVGHPPGLPSYPPGVGTPLPIGPEGVMYPPGVIPQSPGTLTEPRPVPPMTPGQPPKAMPSDPSKTMSRPPTHLPASTPRPLIPTKTSATPSGPSR